MTDAVNEQLSTCLDGELSAAELDLLLKRLERDPELRDAARPLHRHRRSPAQYPARRRLTLLRRQSHGSRRAGACPEGCSHPPRLRISPVLSRSLRPVAGIGIAATVAALAIFSVQRAGVQAPGPIAANEPAVAPTAVVAQSSDDARKLHRADEHFAVGVRAGHAPHELCRRSQRIFLAARPPLGPDRRARGRRWRPGCRDGRRAGAPVSAVSVAAGPVAVSIAPR